MRSFGRRDLFGQVRGLGVVEGSIVVVHSSFRAVGAVEGGPVVLIEALLEAVGPAGTLVMPAMSDWDDNQLFDARQTPCRKLGVVPDTFWRMPGLRRSESPHSFSAKGARAADITLPHPPDLPHGPDSPVGRVHDLDGFVLLLGVGHDANTTIHLAEFLANVPYRSPKFCTVVVDGVSTRLDYGEIDHCCRNFTLVGKWLDERGLERRGTVGNAEARLMHSRDVVATVVEELKKDPLRFLCAAGSGCDECDEARRSTRALTPGLEFAADDGEE